MAYTPPKSNEIDFIIEGGYIAPAFNNIKFTPGSEGPATEYIHLLENPFELNLNLGIIQISTFIPLIPLSSNGSLLLHPIWYYPLGPLLCGNELSNPSLVVSLSLPSFDYTGNLNATIQQRVKLKNFTSFNSMEVQGVFTFPAGTEVIAPWPLLTKSELKIPDFYITLLLPPLIQNNTFEVPFIVAGQTSTITPQPLERHNQLKAGIGLQISVEPLTGSCNLDLLAIKIMPVGDLYLEMVGFNFNYELKNPIIQTGLIIPNFESTNELTVSNIFSGISLTVNSFESTNNLKSNILQGIKTSAFIEEFFLNSDMQVQSLSPVFELNNSLSNQIDVYSGDYLILEPLNYISSLKHPLVSSVFHLPAIENSSELAIPVVNRFTSVAPFIIENMLTIEDIITFTTEHASVYYFLEITDPLGGVDLTIPMSSFQCRMRNGSPTYLKIVIPGVEYSGIIADRSEGDIVVYMAFKSDGKILRKQPIVSTDITDIRIDEGGFGNSITLSGYRTETFIQKSLSLKGQIYRSIVNGKKRVRVAIPNMDLRPGDNVTIGQDTFVADVISYYFRAKKGSIQFNMEVAEA